ncbi:reverse transcriptase domain-containing protein [Tanacetum coccineum]
MIDVFNKKITLRAGDDEVIFDVDQSIKRPPTKDDKCYEVDDLDDMINAEAQELLENKEPDEPIRRITSINTPYPVVHEAAKPVEVEREHLYSASANEINEKKPELKDLPHHSEYTYMHGFFQIQIAPKDLEKTTFTCPYRTFAYRRMPFGLCNAPTTFQRCMTAIFHDMVEDFMEVFMDDFSDAKSRLIRWVMLLQGFDIEIKDKRGAENLAADQLSRLKNIHGRGNR